MIILIPMGGKGSRFSDAGYSLNKACLKTYDRHTGQSLPMVICAMKDIPDIYNAGNHIICIDRELHQENGTEALILEEFSNTTFIHDHTLLDQAYGCFLAKDFLDSEEELFIGTCDSGMEIDFESFQDLKKTSDAIMISHTNDQNISHNPEAHSWAKLQPNGKDIDFISIKKTVSDQPMEDHATTGIFWFKHAQIFLGYLELMIENQDTFDGKYYVDKILQYYLDDQKIVNFQDVKFICWGTPYDYENYQKSYAYWQEFIANEPWLE
ncbi:nucleotidyltransferase [Gammaproteobacteria bacterium]|jgi:NDP-sugar pyrophosphorylase family protein|nr:nucleotidyltransferase [Gammaproteobacteria bacterium]